MIFILLGIIIVEDVTKKEVVNLKPIKPKYTNCVNMKWSISKRSQLIISEYSKYTKYEESELIDFLIEDILEDKSFVEWLKKRRYQTKVNKLIFNSDCTQGDEEDEFQEKYNEEISDF